MHRPAGLARGDQDREVFRIGTRLQSERAADVLGDHPQSLVWNTENRREPIAQRTRALRTAAQKIAVVCRIVACSGAARLHRLHHDALVDKRNPGHILGGCDDSIDVSRVGVGVRSQAGPVDRDIAGGLGPHLRCALENGFAQVDHGRAFLVIDGDELCGVLRRGHRLGNHHRHGFAHVAHRLAGKGRAVRDDELRPAAPGKRRVLRDAADSRHLGGSEHVNDARRGLRRGRVDRPDIGERVRGAHEIRLGLLRHGRVGCVTSKAPHQRIVLQARPVRRAVFNGLCFHVGFRSREGFCRAHGYSPKRN